MQELSDLFDDINEHLRHENRFSLPPHLQGLVDKFCKCHYESATTVLIREEYWRARINAMNQKDAYESSDIKAPPRGTASSGRINPAGISYLYLASDKTTAISEVRPLSRSDKQPVAEDVRVDRGVVW